ncbi:MAG: class I SAM-dependent methyltransferase [Defluviitaleaceae bacterium]|nr:class I SAM-dependent methyltransferase [Defluviitaleaceae bacterium]
MSAPENEDVKNRLAKSLTAESVELLPFLPYLLQDFWELGSEPAIMINLISNHAKLPQNAAILDLGCGKGAVSVKIAQQLKIPITGVDIMPSFIAVAQAKAEEFGVADLCTFAVKDINDVITEKTQYDCIILGAIGSILGDYSTTFAKILPLLKNGGYILIDDAYLTSKNAAAKYDAEYLTKNEWDKLLQTQKLKLIATENISDTSENAENLDSTTGAAAVANRANELTKAYPDKAELFQSYVTSQQNEYADIENDDSLVCFTWLLQKLG